MPIPVNKETAELLTVNTRGLLKVDRLNYGI